MELVGQAAHGTTDADHERTAAMVIEDIRTAERYVKRLELCHDPEVSDARRELERLREELAALNAAAV
jgi:hypothetical protein